MGSPPLIFQDSFSRRENPSGVTTRLPQSPFFRWPFLCGRAGPKLPGRKEKPPPRGGFCEDRTIEMFLHSPALSFLENEVIHHSNWRVQEVLAMAFDSYCKNIGYEQALSIIQKWLQSDNDKQRRAVTEGLRVWTSRPFFKDNPKVAIQLLSALKADPSEYVRKSVGNALRDISKRNPELIRTEIENWDLTDKRIAQVYKLAHRFLEKS